MKDAEKSENNFCLTFFGANTNIIFLKILKTCNLNRHQVFGIPKHQR